VFSPWQLSRLMLTPERLLDTLTGPEAFTDGRCQDALQEAVRLRQVSTLNCRSSNPRFIGWFQSEAVAQEVCPLTAGRPKRPLEI
jgi:hypothetical protein